MNQYAYIVADEQYRVFEAFSFKDQAEGLKIDLKDVGITSTVHEVPMTNRLYDLIVSCHNPVIYKGPYPDLPHGFGRLRSYAINTPTL